MLRRFVQALARAVEQANQPISVVNEDGSQSHYIVDALSGTVVHLPRTESPS